jgi:prepilin-type N-terminal cleavage/methylation domain-containing protein
MFKHRSRRSGFTLPEVLVTVAIVAVLAAMVVPAVTQQISKGDQGQFSGALTAVQTGVTSYVSDVRRFPGALSQLSDAVADGDTALAPNGTLNAGQAARWKGPYLQTPVPADDSIHIGFGVYLMDTVKVSNNYLTIRLNGTRSGSVFEQLDDLFDEGTGKAAGKLTWTDDGAAGTLDSVAHFKLMVAR